MSILFNISHYFIIEKDSQLSDLRSLTFKCTVDHEAAFEDEPTQPLLGNLAMHLKQKHPTLNLNAKPPPDDGTKREL